MTHCIIHSVDSHGLDSVPKRMVGGDGTGLASLGEAGVSPSADDGREEPTASRRFFVTRRSILLEWNGRNGMDGRAEWSVAGKCFVATRTYNFREGSSGTLLEIETYTTNQVVS